MKKVLLFTLILLAFAGKIEAKVEELDVRTCGKCVLKLPENLYFYKYSISSEAIYTGEDEDRKFVGFKLVEDALNNAGIKNFKIVSRNLGASLLFNVITDDTKKNFIPLILSNIEGVEVMDDGADADGFAVEAIKDSSAYNDCRQKSYDTALSELKSRNRADANKYSVNVADTNTRYGEDGTSAEVVVCLESIPNEED